MSTQVRDILHAERVMDARLSERLSAARLRRFVGRDVERELFLSALHATELPFFVLHVYGPGGIGKTTLLRLFVSLCAQVQAPAIHLDARGIAPTPAAFVEALQGAMGLEADEAPAQALAAAARRHILLIDTYEMLAPLDAWLRDVFLPELPQHVLVVTAGRQPLSPTWHADPGWQALLREVPLRALSRDESLQYLTQRRVATGQHRAVLAFTHGHPLALSLVADLFDQRPGLHFQPDAAPDVIKTLVEQFVQRVPGPAHRAGLEASALVRVVNEALLAEMLSTPDAREIFEWMRGVSFIESGPFGLFPHELARDALSADLRWRNPDWFAELHHRARTYYARRLNQTHGQDQQRVLSDYMYLHRDNPVIKPFLDWQETGSAVPDAASEADWPVLCDMVARHEGDASARLAAYWFKRQPEGVLVFRGAEHEPIGFLTMVAVHQATEEDRRADPALRAACRFLDEHAPLRPGERATHFRFWMARDDYQAVSSTQSLVLLKIAQHYLTNADLAYSFFPCADADFWGPFCAYAELTRLPEADYEVGGRRYGVYGHDWRVVPPMMWLDHLAARELDTTSEPIPPPRTETLVVLSVSGFERAVREALRAYARPYTLRDNALLRSRLVLEAAGSEADEVERIEAVRRLLKEAADLLQASPRETKYYRALYRTYFHPASTQEQAAELLDLPLSTFRRHLKTGIQRITEHLWQREIGLSGS